MDIRIIALLLIAGLLLMCGCASRMFYYPTKEVYELPTAYGLAYENVRFASGDGTKLSGWFIPAKGIPKGTVIHFHGNAQNMTSHFSFSAWLPGEGFNVFIFDYRGYGDSEGKPGREGLHQDSLAALKYAASRKDVDPNRLLILGQSLGGANALAAVAAGDKKGIRAVVIDSTFYSYRLIVRDAIKQIPILSLARWPLSFLVVSNKRSPCSVIATLSPIPILILHGTDDGVIPYRHGQMLNAVAREPKEFITVEGGQHTDALTRSDPQYRKRLVKFFEDALK